jgi:hypothetical protein
MLERFIAGRCGVPTSLAATSLSVITGDPRTPDDTLLAKFSDEVRTLVEKALPAGRLDAGFAFVRTGGRAVIAVSAVPQTARVDRVPLVPGSDGKIVIEGDALGPTASVRALVNRGRYAYAECEVSPDVALPRFRVACPCPVAKDDEAAWISVDGLPPGRLLGTPLLEVLVCPAGAPGRVYARLTRAPGGARRSRPRRRCSSAPPRTFPVSA